MVPHTQILEDSRTSKATSATYGALMSQMRSALDNAIASSNEAPRDVHRIHAEILGYERFLRVSGHHLKLLAFLAQTESVAWRTLSGRLAKLPTWESSEGRWSRAASLLGTAHDLVATHVGADRGLRTAEIEDLAGGPALDATARELVDHLNAAEQAGERLVGTTVRAQKRSGEHPTTTSHYGILRSARHSIAVYGRAARWDLREAGRPASTNIFMDSRRRRCLDSVDHRGSRTPWMPCDCFAILYAHRLAASSRPAPSVCATWPCSGRGPRIPIS